MPTSANQTSDRAVALLPVCEAAAFASALVHGSEPPEGILHSQGSYVWQQPGVALVPTALWHAGSAQPEMYLPREKWRALLAALPEYKWGAPPDFPSEQDAAAGRMPAPQVYLLPAEDAQARLAKHCTNYEQWVGLNGVGGEAQADSTAPAFLSVSQQARDVDFAIVYIDESGPLELYFRRDGVTEARLAHIIFWEFFSA